MAELETVQDALVESTSIDPVAAVENAVNESDIRSTIRAAVEKQKAPDDSAAPDRTRDEAGKFAKADEKLAEAARPNPAIAQAPVAEAAVDPVRPPSNWTPVSKVVFDKLASVDANGNVILTKQEAESLRGDVSRREGEIAKGFAKYADFKGLEEYVELAKTNGRALPEVLKDYRSFENTLQTDFLGGIELVCRRFGVHPGSLATAIQSRQGSAPQNGAAGHEQPGRQQAQVDPNAIVKQAIDAMRAEQAQTELSANIQKFAADPKNRFFDNVRPLMASLLNAGHASTLEQAYDMACRADSSVAPLFSQPAMPGTPGVNANAANQARQAGKAVTGAPSAGFSPGLKGLDPNATIRETMRAAIDGQRARA